MPIKRKIIAALFGLATVGAMIGIPAVATAAPATTAVASSIHPDFLYHG